MKLAYWMSPAPFLVLLFIRPFRSRHSLFFWTNGMFRGSGLRSAAARAAM
ncbi:MAG TPA: hypothetical protein VEL80_04980 [Burkholderiales bacterium]|nr:hypothetical protein [Burkholderiales bacterium]